MHFKSYLSYCWLLPLSLILVIFASCREDNTGKQDRTVYVNQDDGNYTLIRNGKPYLIKGAAGQTNLKKLREIGGNTIRTYDTLNLGSILDEAEKNGLAVMVGLPLPESKYSKYVYDNPAASSKLYHDIKQLINKYKDHPAVLMWCVGNELDFSPKIELLNFYSAFNNIVDMIHKDDPNHPITTTMVNLYPKNLFCISMFTDVDVLSTNVFISLDKMEEELEKVSWFWKGPYIISEWGIDGPWAKDRTAWGARVEDTSHQKAERYRAMYQHIPTESPRFLGSFAFYWGFKQETTHTWFSMFDEHGNQTEAVGVLEYLWKGENLQGTSPDLSKLLLNEKGAMENIILKPGDVAEATLDIQDKNQLNSTVWEVYPEDWFLKNNKVNSRKLKAIEGCFTSSGYLQASFKTPSKEGPYRLFATVYDTAGRFATSNIPFYVVSKE